MLSLDLFSGTTDAAKVVALSQEAYRLSPSACTSGVLMTAYLFQAAQELRRAFAPHPAVTENKDLFFPIEFLPSRRQLA